MIDEKMARTTSAALNMMLASERAGFTDAETFEGAQYIVDAHNEIARRNAPAAICGTNVIQLRGRVNAPSRASRQSPITGTNGSRFSFAPVLTPTTTNTEAPQTGDQPSSTGPRR